MWSIHHAFHEENQRLQMTHRPARPALALIETPRARPSRQRVLRPADLEDPRRCGSFPYGNDVTAAWFGGRTGQWVMEASSAWKHTPTGALEVYVSKSRVDWPGAVGV
jgi:hypothetical protein